MNHRRRFLLLAAAGALTLSSCGGGDGDDGSGDGDALAAAVASYELESGNPQRFLVGLTTGDREQVGYGTAAVAFAYSGTPDSPRSRLKPGPRGQATYRLLAGQRASGDARNPRTVGADQGAGVYGLDGVVFPTAGFWEVTVTVRLGGQERKATAAFTVLDDSSVLEVGDVAPRTVNHLPGAADVPLTAIDSRAEETVPDAILHRTTIADALAAGQPLLVVVSTPVYCVSRFCGPITETVEQLATRFDGRMAFVHLELWKNYEEEVVNKAAAEWIFPTGGAVEAREPWVFVVDADGRVAYRFDNVVNDAELERAIEDVLS